MAYTVTAKQTGRLRNYYRPHPGDKPRLDKGRSFTDPAEAEIRRLWLEENWESRGPRAEKAAAMDALEQFLASRRLSPRTLDYYRVILNAFFAWQGKKDLAEWEPRDLERFMDDRAWKAPRTAATYVRACRLFVKWAKKRRIACADFASMVEIPRQVTPDVAARTREEADAVLAKGLEDKSPVAVAVALARYAGFPLADIRSVTWAEVRFDLGEIHHTRSKTGVSVELPIAAELLAVLTLPWVRATHGPVCRGLPGTDKRAIEALHRLERSVGVHAGYMEGYHAYRRTYGTEAASLPGVTYGDVNYLMMHKPGSKESLKYVKVNMERVKAAVAHGAKPVEAAARAGG